MAEPTADDDDGTKTRTLCSSIHAQSCMARGVIVDRHDCISNGSLRQVQGAPSSIRSPSSCGSSSERTCSPPPSPTSSSGRHDAEEQQNRDNVPYRQRQDDDILSDAETIEP